MKDEPRPVHQLDHTEPTVIHHPEEDMTVLARWLQRGMEQGARFWLLLGGVVVAIAAIAFISSGLVAAKSAGSEAWVELTQAKTVEDRLKFADAHPDTPVAGWAKLLSAQEEYSNGIDDLTAPGKKELAGPRLKKALEIFQQVAKEAPKDSTQSLVAMFGVARTMEARNELLEAIEQYRAVATKFPKTPEAKQALALAKALEEPENVTFYKELYAYKPPATPPSSSGTGGLGGPGSLFQTPSPGGSSLKSLIDLATPPPGLDAPPPTTAPVPAPASTTPAVDPPKGETSKADAPKAETPKAETPAAPAEAPKDATPPK